MVDIVRSDVILCDLNPVMGTEQAGNRIIRVLGHLDKKKMEEVVKALSTILGL